MPLDTDFHSHVSRSSARPEWLSRPKKKGCAFLGLSEHIFQMKESRLNTLNILPLEGPLLTFPTYIRKGTYGASRSGC